MKNEFNYCEKKYYFQRASTNSGPKLQVGVYLANRLVNKQGFSMLEDSVLS